MCIYVCLLLKTKKIPQISATSKTWTRILDPDLEKPGPRKTWTLKNLDPEKLGPWKTWTLKNLDPEKPGPWKIWTLKNLDPEKHGINIGLRNMSDFRELCFIKIMRNVIYCLKVRVLTAWNYNIFVICSYYISVLTDIWTKCFRLKIVLIITKL